MYKKDDTKDFYQILFSGMTAMFITYTLKYLLKVPRPETMLVTAEDYRFPSGHATMAAVVMTLSFYYTHRYIHKKYVRYALYVLALSWLVIVSYSRLYLHAHYFIDILAGGMIGALATYVVLKIFKHLHYYK